MIQLLLTWKCLALCFFVGWSDRSWSAMAITGASARPDIAAIERTLPVSLDCLPMPVPHA
jgi:hypothetical protein